MGLTKQAREVKRKAAEMRQAEYDKKSLTEKLKTAGAKETKKLQRKIAEEKTA